MARTVSNPFRVQVRAQGSVGSLPFASIDDFALEGIWTQSPAWVDPQGRGTGNPFHGKHTAFMYCPWDGKIYGFGGDGFYPGELGVSSGIMQFSRYTFNAQGSNATYDQYYPHYGIAGVPFPVGQDQNPWAWDGSRNCFWTVGGYSWNFAAPGARPPGHYVGIAARSGGSNLWRFFVQTGQWELVRSDVANWPTFATGLIYHPQSDCLVWPRGVEARFAYYNCATGAMGTFWVGTRQDVAPFSGPFPGVTYVPADPSASEPREDLSAYTIVYDSETNEIIWRCMDRRYNCIFATSLANFPGNCTSRQIVRGLFDGSVGSALGEAPMFIRGTGANRKLYTYNYPWGTKLEVDGITPGGAGLGIYEINLTTAEVKQASQPYFLNFTPNRSDQPIRHAAFNEGSYSPAADRMLATSQIDTVTGVGGGNVGIFRWSPPSWTPAAGNVKAITTDIFGRAVNDIGTPGVLGYTSRSDMAQPWAWGTNGAIISAWAGGAYARNMSTNGCLLIHNGGDGDYWGNEVYAFDFDTRKWYRVSNSSAAMTGGPSGMATDPQLATNNAKYFNIAECEHGPLVAPTGACSNGDWGILPSGTQPGVPHTYAGLQWIPGKFIGNRRGALVRPVSTYVYTTRSTTRAHYFDLDRLNSTYYTGQQWGRLSKNRLTVGGFNPATSALDESAGRIYHNYGYLDLDTKMQVSKSWGQLPHDGSSCFDPRRRVWVGVGAGTLGQPGSLWARRVDFEEAAFNPTVTGDQVWDGGQGQYGGLEYCPNLDCFFFYNVNGQAGATPTPQVIWKIAAPTTNFKAAAWSIQRITMGGDTVALAPAGVRGSYSRLRWISPLKCLAFYHGGPVYLYKPQGL